MISWFHRFVCAGLGLAAAWIGVAQVGTAWLETTATSPSQSEIVDFVIEDLNGDGEWEIVILKKMSAAERAVTRFDEIYEDGTLPPLSAEAERAAEGLVFANGLMVLRPGDALVGLPRESAKQELTTLMEAGTLETLYAVDFTSLRPLMLRTGNIDGDDFREISVCVFKTTEFHPIYAKRPFIYRYGSGVLRPVWRGSRLSKPFDDYLFADMDGDGMEELVSLEIARDGGKVISCYGWRDFGFALLARSPIYGGLYQLRQAAAGEIAVTVSELEKTRALRLVYRRNENGNRFEDEGTLVEIE